MKMNNVFPINLSYKFGKGINSTSAKPAILESRISNPTSLEFQKASGNVAMHPKLVGAR